jgi:hypothetical protein
MPLLRGTDRANRCYLQFLPHALYGGPPTGARGLIGHKSLRLILEGVKQVANVSTNLPDCRSTEERTDSFQIGNPQRRTRRLRDDPATLAPTLTLDGPAPDRGSGHVGQITGGHYTSIRLGI